MGYFRTQDGLHLSAGADTQPTKEVANGRKEIKVGDPRYDRESKEERRKGVKGVTGHSPGIRTAWENNGQRDEREEKGGEEGKNII